MDARNKLILVETKTFILKEALVDSDGESVFIYQWLQNKIYFCFVHCQFPLFYIAFFQRITL